MSDIDRYIEIAKVCKASYAGPINQTLYTSNGIPYAGQRIVHGSFKRGFGRLFWGPKSATIVFRGTRDKIDWFISNGKAFPVRLHDCDDPENVRVHRGFQRTLKYIDKTTRLPCLDAMTLHLEKECLLDRPLLIVGHSLGGALACLFAVKLRHRFPKYVTDNLTEIVTFGSPSVGNGAFLNHYSDLGHRTTRIVNRYDIVPFMPPFGFRHVGREIWLDGDQASSDIGWRRRLREARNSGDIRLLLRDHSMNAYLAALQQAKASRALEALAARTTELGATSIPVSPLPGAAPIQG
ncbi:lipase family protein [Microvirga zambiensis]|uniref:lipase family protein n=1 Tax=Microvirga zambiensis TaxID=1402137 RepID=UPI00191DAF55